MGISLRLLLVEDSPTDAKLTVAALRRAGHEVEFDRVDTEAGLRAALAERSWDVITCDWNMPELTAPAALAILKDSGLDIPFIIVSGTVGEEPAVEMMRAGAHDYVLKDRIARLAPAVERELREARSRNERRRATTELAASEARYKRIIETSNQGVWMIDVNGKTTFLNERMAQMLGVPAAEVIGRSPAEFLDDEGRAHLSSARTQHRAGASYQHEIRLVRPDGKPMWALLETSPSLDANGEYVGSFAMAMDVTARRLAEASQRISDERFRALWNSGIILISISDVTGKLVDVNDGFERVVGYPREELLSGRVRWNELTSAKWTDADRSALSQLAKTGVATPWEKELVAKDGTRVPILAGAVMLGDENITIAIDLTERKRVDQALQYAEQAKESLEAQLRQAQKLEAIGSLAGGVAHDFNNILSVILTYTDLIQDDLAPDHALRGDIEEIHAAAMRASGLTKQLLAFSRQQVLQPRVLDLNAVIGDLQTMLRRLLSEDIELAIHGDPSIGNIHADPGQIEQVLLNLVVNARDAMPCGGKVTIETSNLFLDEAFAADHVGITPGRHTVLRVSDTGEGIPEDVRARIFDPFFTTKATGRGTGLGLSMVHGIVRQSGGVIFVDSQVGVGTEFTVYLPSTTQAVPAIDRTTVASGGSETILLCEDEPQVRAVTRTILARNGYRVIEAQNGGEALTLCEQHPCIDLLVTDVVMPLMSGRQLAERLRVMRPELKVLYMSGYTDDAIVRHGIFTDELAFLQKPVTPDALARKVRELLDTRARAS